MLKYHYFGWAGYSQYDVSIVWLTEKLYFTSTNEDDYNTEKISDYLKDISNNDLKGIYIGDSVDANMEGGNNTFGTQSYVRYQGDPSLLFKEHPMKSSGGCLNYTKYQTNERLYQYNNYIFDISQANHPEVSSDY